MARCLPSAQFVREFPPAVCGELTKDRLHKYLADILLRGTENEKREFYEQGRAEIEIIHKRLDDIAAERQTTMRRAI